MFTVEWAPQAGADFVHVRQRGGLASVDWQEWWFLDDLEWWSYDPASTQRTDFIVQIGPWEAGAGDTYELRAEVAQYRDEQLIAWAAQSDDPAIVVTPDCPTASG